MKIDGRSIAQEILDNLRAQTQNLKEKGITPTLAIILMGDNEASTMYVKQKKLKAEEIGAEVKIFQFAAGVTNEEIESQIKKLDSDPKINGIILQRPAPAQIKVEELEEFISPRKEIDGFGQDSVYPVPVAEAVWRMLLTVENEQELQTKSFAVLGKGETAGLPIINYLNKQGIKPAVVDSKTENRGEVIKNSEIVISAVGKENTLRANELKKGAILIGVGLSSNSEGKLVGDFNQEEIESVVSAYSPTPGGVGPVNVAILLENLISSAQKPQ